MDMCDVFISVKGDNGKFGRHLALFMVKFPAASSSLHYTTTDRSRPAHASSQTRNAKQRCYFCIPKWHNTLGPKSTNCSFPQSHDWLVLLEKAQPILLSCLPAQLFLWDRNGWKNSLFVCLKEQREFLLYFSESDPLALLTNMSQHFRLPNGFSPVPYNERFFDDMGDKSRMVVAQMLKFSFHFHTQSQSESN